MTATVTHLPVSAPDPVMAGLARAFSNAGMTSADVASWDRPGIPRPAQFQALADALDWVAVQDAEWEASWLARWESLTGPGAMS